MINSIVCRDDKGHYGWDLQNPPVQEEITVFEERVLEEGSLGLIKAEFICLRRLY